MQNTGIFYGSSTGNTEAAAKQIQKELRSLVLHTMSADEQYKTEELLARKGISYTLQRINSSKINVFFGKEQCVRIIESFGKKLEKYRKTNERINSNYLSITN